MSSPAPPTISRRSSRSAKAPSPVSSFFAFDASAASILSTCFRFPRRAAAGRRAQQIEKLARVGSRVDLLSVGQQRDAIRRRRSHRTAGCRTSAAAYRAAAGSSPRTVRRAADRRAPPARTDRPASSGARCNPPASVRCVATDGLMSFCASHHCSCRALRPVIAATSREL